MATIMAFTGIAKQPVNEWDEARNGINAIELLKNQDFLNLYYVDEPDNWHIKPPFYSWLIAFSINTIGYNTFALRLPNAIATILIFFFIFKIVRLYKNDYYSFFICASLFGVKGILCIHVGRTADIDGVLTLNPHVYSIK